MHKIALLLLCALGFRVATMTSTLPVLIGIYVVWGILALAVPIRFKLFTAFLISSIAIRGLMIGIPFVFSDDVFRYLWEGQLLFDGGNPYVTPPSVFETMDGVRERVNHPTISAIYPPFAQFLFAVVSQISYTTLAMQIFFGMVDVGTAVGVWYFVHSRDLDLRLAWLYAMHPLAVIEVAGMAHLDGLAIALTIWGMNSERFRTWCWFIGSGVKIFPVLLLPMSRNWRISHTVAMMAITMLCGWYFWDPSLLTVHPYAQHWSFNSFIFSILSLWNGYWARVICIVLAMIVVLYGIQRVRCRNWLPIFGWYWMGATFVLLSPTVHPWYALWVWVPSLLQQQVSHWPWTWFVTLMPIAYVSLATLDSTTGQWSPPIWPTFLIYGTLCVLLYRTRYDGQ